MKASFISRTINPALPCQMEGYSTHASTGQYDDLELCTVLIDCGSPILIHVLDIVLFERELSARIRSAVERACAIPAQQVLLFATHTHSGPKVSRFLDPHIPPDAAYLDLLEAAVVENSRYCLANAVPARAHWGTCTLDGIFSNRNGLELPYQEQGQVLALTAQDGAPIAHLLQCACHPTVLGGENSCISSDYMGSLRRAYTAHTGAPCLALNGACGDVSTRLTRQGQDWAEVQRVGTRMAERFAAASAALRPVELAPVEQTVVERSYDFFPSEKDLLKQPRETRTHTHTAYVCRWGGLNLVAAPGEMVSELGRRLREAAQVPLVLGCYANDFHGYAVNREAYGHYFESFCTQYPVGAADDFVAAICAALHRKEGG